MKAAVFKAPGTPLVIEDVPDPTPGPSDLILKVRACGICGTDLHWSESRNGNAGWRALDPDTVMGHEFAGEIVEVGRDVRGQWRVGDRVCAQPFIGCGRCAHCVAGRAYRCEQVRMRATSELTGAYAEYTRIGAATTLRLPDAVSFHEGALVEPLAVGLNAVAKARLEPGDCVLIMGAGPVGIAIALWCRFFGARHIVVSDLISQRAARAIEFGATAMIDASREDVTSRVEQLTGGQPRVVFDCVGVPGSLQLAIDYAPFDARVVVVGLCMAADRFFPAKAITKELDLTFVFVYRRRDFEIVVDLLGRGRIEANGLVTDRVGFERFSEAFEALKKPSDQIKVMLEPH
jgi:(R,R)-butanediol dehydrogenase / meso-butanediol dehydrogenase / diacetyl reductase